MRLLKFNFCPAEEIELTMPKGAQVVSVISLRDAPGVWALVDPAAPLETRRFRTVAAERSITDLPDNLRFVGSFSRARGDVVFHFFEIVGSSNGPEHKT